MAKTSDTLRVPKGLEQAAAETYSEAEEPIMQGARCRWNWIHKGRAYAPVCFFLLAVTLFVSWPVASYSKAQLTLDEINYSALPGDRLQLELTLSDVVSEPLSFAIDKPARIALDFPGVRSNLAYKSMPLGVGMARSLTALEAGERTRVVVSLSELVPYDIRAAGRKVYVTLNSPTILATAAGVPATTAVKRTMGDIKDIDFRRGQAGEGRITVTLSSPSMIVDTREEGGKLIVQLIGADLPKRLQRRLDVTDFATPVQVVDTFSRGPDTRILIEATPPFDHLAYQADNLYTIEVKPVSKAEQELAKKEKFQYNGERLSLNFQDIEVRAVLQLLADFTGLNLVASDSVNGNLTLRLKNVPWDQALDIVLKARGLAMRKVGNVIMVAPTEEIAAREKLELEAEKQRVELAPLQTEFIQVNYAKAGDLASLLKAPENSLLSERGHVTVDERTNTLLVRDNLDNLQAISRLVNTLDVPVRQVLIESRIVIADETFSRDLGITFGFSYDDSNIPDILTLGGKRPGDTKFSALVPNPNTGQLEQQAIITGFETPKDTEGLIVDLPVANPAAALGFVVGKLGSNILQLELSAAQEEGRGETLSNPRVITSDRKEAIIEQGVEIPFQEATSSGATSTSFKKAVLSLKVKPQITPDDRIIMDIQVNKDRPGKEFAGIPSVDTRSVTTQVLVDNGETVVLGGIYEQDLRDDRSGVPFFQDIPYLGFLFQRTEKRDDKKELLIFVTPKVLKEALTLR
ncbi:MAG: type IV pilus secretin PilQ family protein [Gammaproteobacteria bacterium]